MLILSQYIARHELNPLKRYFNIEDLILGARKVVKGLAQKMSSVKRGSDFHFYKVRIGDGAKGRMIVFVVSQNKKVVPLLIRLKKDKKMRMNMSVNNSYVVDQLDKNLSHVLEDMKNGNFNEFEL